MKRFSTLLVVLSLLAFTLPATRVNAITCDATVVDVATTETKATEADSPDVYVATDTGTQIGVGSVFKVFRHKKVIERQLQEHALKLYLGRLQIIDARNNVWVGRMVEFAKREDYPRVRYETIMIGDCLELESPAYTTEIPTLKSVPEGVGVSAPEIPAGPEKSAASQVSAGEETERATTRYPIPTKILFAFDSSHIDNRWDDELQRLAEFIAARRPAMVIVEGHTCSIGSEAYNMGLSRRRAQAVVDYLTKHGLDKNLFEIRAFGETRPEVSNETEEGRRKNRRAVMSVLVKIIPTVEAPAISKPTGPTVSPEKLIPENAGIPTIPSEASAGPPAVQAQP